MKNFKLHIKLKGIIIPSVLLIMCFCLNNLIIAQTPNFLLSKQADQTITRERATLWENDWNPANDYVLWNFGRYSHDMAYVGDDKVLLFGGKDKGRLQGTYIYDLSQNGWIWKSNLDPMPENRMEHALAYIGGDKVLLFGGNRQYASWLNDTWIYDRSDNDWTQKLPAKKPGIRQMHAMAYIGDDKVLLFGGNYSDQTNNETWIYDLSANNWTQKTPASSPSARLDHGMAYIGGDKVLMFGGKAGATSLIGYNDTWVYDLSANSWTSTYPLSQPSGRYGHGMVYIGNNQVVLYGGGYWGGYPAAFQMLEDTWVFDLNDNLWTEDINGSGPGDRYQFGFSESSMDGSSTPVLFGGQTAGGWDNLETWLYGGGDYLKEEFFSPTGIRSLTGYSSAIPFAWKRPDQFSKSSKDPNSTPLNKENQSPWIPNGILLRDPVSHDNEPSDINFDDDNNRETIQGQTPTGYNVYRRKSSAGSYTKIASNIHRQYYRDENIISGQTYYYKVTAVYSGGESELTSAVSSKTTTNGYKISSGAALSIPTLDGVINSSEWANASQTVITHPDKSGNVILYCMNNSEKLFVAVNDPLDTSLDHHDQFVIILDQNKDREFPSTTPSNEGHIYIYWDGGSGSTSTLFRPRSGYWPDHLSWEAEVIPAGVAHGMSIKSGHVQYEGSIDLDTFPHNISAGDVIGILVFVFDYSIYNFTGFWPQTADQLKHIAVSHDQTPFSYGNLKLAYVTASEEPDITVPPKKFALSQNYPNPFNNVTTIHFHLEVQNLIELRIYNLVGKEITTLISETMEPGEYSVRWNAKGLPSGIYLYCLKAGNHVKTKKLVLQK